MDNKITVFLVDDHAIVRAGIKQYLELTNQISVIGEADNGISAIHLFNTLRPEIAVLDIQMPEMNGIELTRWIKQNYPNTGILILSAYDDDPYVEAALKAGANGFVLKTSTPEEIVNAVLDVKQGKAVLDSELTRRMMYKIVNPSSHTYEKLSSRELEVLLLTGKGLSNKEIAAQLDISTRTVQNHLANIFGKLQASSRTEAVMRAVSLGLIPSDLIE